MTSSRRLWVAGVLVAIAVVLSAIAVSRRAGSAPRGSRSRAETIRSELFAEIQPVRITNCELQRFGEPHDGGYPLCANLLRDVKAGYSYGIDVEGAEWDAFLLAPDSTLLQIDQLDVEFHHVDDAKYVETIRRLKPFFHIAHVRFNNFSCDASLAPFPSWAFEVLLVNKRIARSDGSPAPAASGVDAPNDASTADCQATARSAAQAGSVIQGVHVL